jgi:uncharacterized protein
MTGREGEGSPQSAVKTNVRWNLPPMPDRKDECEPTLGDLHTEVDRQTDHLRVLHAKRLQCRKGCCGCCVDGLTVFEVEAESIRHHHAALLAEGAPHPKGACAFLDDAGACRIYEHRPYVCRTQGLPLRWIEERSDGNPVELRDICPLNEHGPPVESLPAEECWSIGPYEGRLANLQAAADNGELRRVSLRSLFRRR